MATDVVGDERSATRRKSSARQPQISATFSGV
jgi:hypothetical protein